MNGVSWLQAQKAETVLNLFFNSGAAQAVELLQYKNHEHEHETGGRATILAIITDYIAEYVLKAVSELSQSMISASLPSRSFPGTPWLSSDDQRRREERCLRPGFDISSLMLMRDSNINI